MALSDKEIVTILGGLIEICKDGQQGYKDAADDIKDKNSNKELTKLLMDYSMQREKFMYELQLIVKTFGGDVDLSGSFLGALHRRWMDVRFGIAGNNSEAILKECLRGDKAAISRYKEVIKSDLPEQIKNVINRQLEEISESYEIISRLLLAEENRVPDTN
jgi:uncharacterized protein (TIGR02284 family)